MAMKWLEDKKYTKKRPRKNSVSVSANERNGKVLLTIGFPPAKAKDVTKTQYVQVGFDPESLVFGIKEGTSKHCKLYGTGKTTARRYFRVYASLLDGFPQDKAADFVGEYKLIPEMDRSWTLEKIKE